MIALQSSVKRRAESPGHSSRGQHARVRPRKQLSLDGHRPARATQEDDLQNSRFAYLASRALLPSLIFNFSFLIFNFFKKPAFKALSIAVNSIQACPSLIKGVVRGAHFFQRNITQDMMVTACPPLICLTQNPKLKTQNSLNNIAKIHAFFSNKKTK